MTRLVIGCNYHATWQSDKRMRFVLTDINEEMDQLSTRRTRKKFWTKTNTLIFIETPHNEKKRKELNCLKN